MAMQIVAYGSLFVSVALLFFRSRWSFFFSGVFLSTADPRFVMDLGVVNVSILGLYIWALIWLVYFTIVRPSRTNKILPFALTNRLALILVVALVLLAISLFGNFETGVKSFILIFLPYFVLLPFGAALADADSRAYGAKLSFLRGLQAGYLVYIVLTQIFAPGEITGALGDISVNATIVGVMCSYGLLITVFLIRWDANHKLRSMDLVALAIFAVSALQTLSRGPLFAIAAALPFQLLNLNRHRLRRSRDNAFIVLLSIAGTVALVVANANDVLEKRNIQVGFDLREQFLSSRYNYIQQVVDFSSMSLADLMIGHGLGASEQIARSLGAYRIESFWLEAAYDIGIPFSLLLLVALARNAWALARREPIDEGGFGSLYLSLFLFTLFLSPSSFGWFLQGNAGFVYVAILMLACTHSTTTQSQMTPAVAHGEWRALNKRSS